MGTTLHLLIVIGFIISIAINVAMFLGNKRKELRFRRSEHIASEMTRFISGCCALLHEGHHLVNELHELEATQGNSAQVSAKQVSKYLIKVNTYLEVEATVLYCPWVSDKDVEIVARIRDKVLQFYTCVWAVVKDNSNNMPMLGDLITELNTEIRNISDSLARVVQQDDYA